VNLEASVDGAYFQSLEQYRVQSPFFGLTFGKNNIINLLANTTTEAVANGNRIFLKPLPIGKHIIYFKGGLESRNVSTNSSNTVDAAFAGPYIGKMRLLIM
jgi:hypothetical protein